MKKYLLFASALLAFASCANDNYLGTEDEQRLAQGEKPITFGFDVPAATRAEVTGATAAGKLNNQFIVYGEKSEADGSAPVTDGSKDHQLVFRNYVVNYSSSTAFTTTSNTKDWEYVGQTPYASNVTPATGETAQTIKYWDYGSSNYVFTAVSALPEDITAGRVQIEKTTSGTTVYDKGYVVTLDKDGSNNYPSLADLYFSDRNVITKSSGYDRTAKDAYGGNATLKFRNSLTQVRVGMYETIPGYAISAISFKVTADAAAVDGSSNPAFGAICPNVKADNFVGTITVTYYDGTATAPSGPVNTPKLTITPGTGLSKTDLILGTNINAITKANPMATSAATPTWDQAGGLFTSVLPQIGNTTNLKLKVNYTLYNSVTGETITVENATAEVPADYLKWKPNFKYTYLFKISDDTNGHSGTSTDPAGLYPITFDAVVVEAEDGQAEYITTVSEPSITTFGVKDSKYIVDANEYPATSDIYATFVEGSNVKTPILGDSGAQHVNVYTVSSDDDTNFPVTEASVAEAIAKGPSSITNPIYTYDGTDTYTAVANASDLARGTTYYKKDANNVAPGGTGYVQTLAVDGTDYNIASVVKYTAYTTNVTLEATVPTEDNKTITLANSAKALKMASVAEGTYAIEYEASAAWTGSYKKVYKVIKVTAAP